LSPRRAPLAWDRRVESGTRRWPRSAMSCTAPVCARSARRAASSPRRSSRTSSRSPRAGWLATSPELAMKRLLCRGSGPIFQLAHVFRGRARRPTTARSFTCSSGTASARSCGARARRRGGRRRGVRGGRRRERSPAALAAGRLLRRVRRRPPASQLRGDEDDGAARDRGGSASCATWSGSGRRSRARWPARSRGPRARAWTGLFSAWSIATSIPGWRDRSTWACTSASFPRPLAALAQRGARRAGGRPSHRVPRRRRRAGQRLPRAARPGRAAAALRAGQRPARRSRREASLPLDEDVPRELGRSRACRRAPASPSASIA
jgi:hypothetical protein